MRTATRIAAFLIALTALFALAVGAGRIFGPSTEVQPTAHSAHDDDGSDEVQETSTDEASAAAGLMIAQDGYSLALTEPEAASGDDVPVTFTIFGPDGRPVTSYDEEHGKRLHLIAVRRDFTGFQHAHPQLSEDGMWSTTLDLPPGQWRLFADFRATGMDALTLGADLAVAGDYRPSVRTEESRTAEVDGYTVALDGELRAGGDATLTLSVSRHGDPVTDLEPYLGAYGHLVALRSGDLAYLHVHPEGTPGDGTTKPGPEAVFSAAVPSNGTYHLYLDFKHEGVVRTATFTVHTTGAGTSFPSATSEDHSSPSHGRH